MTSRLAKIVGSRLNLTERQIQRALPKIASVAGKHLTEAVRAKVLEADAIATGRFYRSIKSTAIYERQSVKIVVSSDVSYAQYILGGRRPGRMPPVQAIAGWIAVKRLFHLNPYVVARAIGRRGIKARRFFDRGWRVAGERVKALVRRRLLDELLLGRP